MDGPLIYVIAGEPSGDFLGGRLMAALIIEKDNQLKFRGVGGQDMTSQGLISLFPMSDLSVMGIMEVVPKIPKLLGRISEVVKDIIDKKPDVVITIDAPDFCFRVAKRLKGKRIPVIHYVAPTVWAWRQGRAAKIAKFLDHIFCLFPFEPPYFEREGLSATFIGHSIIETAATSANGNKFRTAYGISPYTPVLAILPGSRIGEVNRHLPVFKETIIKLQTTIPNIELISITTNHIAEAVKAELNSWPIKSIIIETNSKKYDAMAAANVALAASGTVTLELAVVGTPSIVIYQVNALTAFIAKFLVSTKYVSLINILLDQEITPEMLIDNCKAKVLVPEILNLLQSSKAQEKQKSAFKTAIKMLSPLDAQSPSQKAAQTIIKLIS
jgi:lipid-A-disaccharide synthase